MRLVDLFYAVKIWVRITALLWLTIAAAWSGMLAWTIHVQRETALAQAREFAESVHQMTLAGLTGMMITGTGARRDVFLDQIERSRNVRSLRIIRGEPVIAQYGVGKGRRHEPDTIELEVLQGGVAVQEVRRDPGGDYMKVVMPVVGLRDYLGKDCLGCHRVAQGTVLGAVSMELKLDSVNAAVSSFSTAVIAAALLVALPLALLVYLVTTRFVTRPLDAVTRGLNMVAEGGDALGRPLPVRGADEVAQASRAFNRVMERARALLKAERVAADVFEHALEGILITDREGRIVKVNRAFTETTGYAEEEAIGQTPRMLQSGKYDAGFYAAFWKALMENGQWKGDLWNRRKNGEIYAQSLNVSSVRDEHGGIEYFIAIFSDITERKKHEAVIAYHAYHDALTGLPNRTVFKDRLQQAVATARRQDNRPLAVMFLDLDGFKQINDTLGHEVGDLLLKEVARRLRDVLREEDTVARIGGDEFTVLLPEVAGPEGAATVAERIVAVLKLPFRMGKKEIPIGASLGISLFPQDAEAPDDLLLRADQAMYRAKTEGRGRYCLYQAPGGIVAR